MNDRWLAPARALFMAAIAAAVGASAPDGAGRLRADVDVLAADAMMGRDPARPEFAEAAAYVARQFAAAGLRPGGDGGWYQTVPLARYRPVGPGTATWAPTRGGVTRLRPGIDFYAEGDPAAPTRHIAAPVVFVGYGIAAPGAGHDDYRGVDVRGKIVAALFGGPKTPDAIDRALLWDQGAKRQAAAARGAAGFINVHLDEPGMAPFATGGKIALREQIGLAGRDRAGDMPDGTAPVLATFSESGAKALFGPDWKRAGHAVAARGILTIDTATRITPIPSRNVIGVLPGSDPRMAKEVVVVSAHLDHVGVAPDDGSSQATGHAGTGVDRINNGALDNAIGVAAMLDTARRLTAMRPRRSVMFLAVTAEEIGLLGSAYFAAHPTVPLRDIVADINIDMPILTYRFDDLTAFGADRSTLAGPIARAAAVSGADLTPDTDSERALYARSDQFSFARRGIPAVMIWPGRRGDGAAAIDDFLDHQYHRPSDDTRIPIRWDQADRYTAIVTAIVRDVADATARPAMVKAGRRPASP